MMKRLLRKPVQQRIGGQLSGHKTRWPEFEYFHEAWRSRIEVMARHIPPGHSVMDLGCGKQWLREYLSDCEYIPVDWAARSPDTIVCDFNAREFPSRTAYFAFVSGCLEYVDDPEWFAQQIGEKCSACVLSYCTVDKFPVLEARVHLGWRHNLRASQVVQLFKNAGFELATQGEAQSADSIFVFTKIPPD